MIEDTYRLVKRGQYYYAHNKHTGTRESLKTGNETVACRLLATKNEAAETAALNREKAKIYLKASDPKLESRTWSEVMDVYAQHGKPASQVRSQRAFQSKSFDKLRDMKLKDTRHEHFQSLMKNGAACINYLRRVHNLALRKRWLPEPIFEADDWPVIEKKPSRPTTSEEHGLIIGSESNVERSQYYQMLWETGAAQSDGALLGADNITPDGALLIYHRKKTGEKCQLAIGRGLRKLLLQLPTKGYFFPNVVSIEPKYRSSEFKRRCRLLGISGITLHSYRYSWAHRAYAAGYPMRFAQAALGHQSKAVAEAYARSADIICPPMDEYEDKVIRMCRKAG